MGILPCCFGSYKMFEDVPRRAKEYLVFTCVKCSFFRELFNRNQNQNMEQVVFHTVKADFFFFKKESIYIMMFIINPTPTAERGLIPKCI